MRRRRRPPLMAPNMAPLARESPARACPACRLARRACLPTDCRALFCSPLVLRCSLALAGSRSVSRPADPPPSSDSSPSPQDLCARASGCEGRSNAGVDLAACVQRMHRRVGHHFCCAVLCYAFAKPRLASASRLRHRPRSRAPPRSTARSCTPSCSASTSTSPNSARTSSGGSARPG